MNTFELKKNILLILLLSSLFSCNEKENKTISSFIPENEIVSKYKDLNLSKAQINQALSLGLLTFEDSLCEKEIIVKDALNFNNYIDSFKIQDFENFAGNLYQLFGDPTIPQNENLTYEKLSIDSLITILKSGQLAPQCEGISRITKEIIEKNTKENITVGIQRINTVIHTLNSITIIQNNKNYGLLFDVQNGFFFPSKGKNSLSFYSLSEIDSLNQLDYDFSFYWLKDSILLRKRNLVDHILPCNLLPQLGTNYHYPQTNSPYKYELLGPSFHKILWFDLGQIDKVQLKKELISKLINHNSKINNLENQ